MRHMKDSPLRRRAALLIASAIVFALVAVPTIALAATPHSTLATTYMYMAKAKSFTISGRIAASTHGKYITVEIKKPGRTFWTPVASAKIGTTGAWHIHYTPKLGGTFKIRARYGTTTAGISRTATVIVRTGPGTKSQIVLASTTSTRDSGLFEALRPMFLAQNPEYTLKATFVGSGAAIHLALDGNADVVLAHSPAAELDAMNGIYSAVQHAIHGVRHYKVMYNDYVLVGPTANPAAIAIGDSAQVAFGKLASTGSTFWSRNDASGTNSKEKEIWALLGNPQGTVGSYASWYKASGTMGMAQALAAANDASTGGYTLSDRATWLNATSLGTTSRLKIVNEGDSRYFNQYGIFESSGARNAEGARDFSLWLRCPTAQTIIANYGLDTYGRTLFTPNAGAY
jgi:tungstate transport system substrate-binding protein